MQSLEQELQELKGRIERLEREVSRLTQEGEPAVSPPQQAVDQEHLVAWLKAEGLIREATIEEQHDAAGWDALSEEEKQAVRQELDNLPERPMVSDIIIDNRS